MINLINKYQSSTFFLACLLILSILSYFSFGLSSVDSAHYYSAIESFDLAKEQPHLPGYILYIYSLKLINFLLIFLFENLFDTKIASILLLNVLLSSFSSTIFFRLSLSKLSVLFSFVITFAYFTFPNLLFYSTSTENYILDFFFSTILIYSVHKKFDLGNIFIIIAIASGFRQSFALYYLPMLMLFIILKSKKYNIINKKIVFKLIISIIIIISWLIPLIMNSGGLKSYLELYFINSPFPKSDIFTNLISLLSFNLYSLIIIILFFYKELYEVLIKLREGELQNSIYFSLLIIIWSILCFILFHYNKGYILIILPLIYYLIIQSISENQITLKKLIIIILLNLVFYFAIPYKMPSVETSIPNNLRNSSQIKILYDRLIGNYLTTYNLAINNQYNIKRINDFCYHIALKDSILNFAISNSCQVDNKILNQLNKNNNSSKIKKFIHIDRLKIDSQGKINIFYQTEFIPQKIALILRYSEINYIKYNFKAIKTIENLPYIAYIIEN